MHRCDAPSRRTFLAATAAATATAGALPLLSACSSGGNTDAEGATTGKDLKDVLPAFVPRDVPEPQIPSRNGSVPGYTELIPAGDLKTSVPARPASGGQYTVMTPLWGTPPKPGNAYYRAMDQAIGVTVDWQVQDGNVYGEKLGAVLAGSSIPDLVCVPGWELSGKIPSAIAHRFADLGPYLSGDRVKEYPNLAAVPTAAWQMSVFGGKLRGLPMPAPQLGDVLCYYRQDVFEERGWAPPDSAAAFLDLAREMTAPKAKVWACEDMKWTAFKIFGVLPEKPSYWELVDGKLRNRYETDAYLEALEWTRKLFAAGVVHPDARASQGDAGNRFSAGQTMMFNTGGGDWYGRVSEQSAQNPDFRMQAMDFFHHDGGDPVLWAGNPATIWSFVNEKLPEDRIRECLAIADFTAAPFGTEEHRLVRYGVAGVHHTVESGVLTKTPQGERECQDTYLFLAGPAPARSHPDQPQVVRDYCSWEQRMGRFVKKPLFYGMQIQEPTRYTNLADNFEELEDDVTRGRRKVGDMQQAVSDWRRQGGDELRDWYRRLLDEQGSGA